MIHRGMIHECRGFASAGGRRLNAYSVGKGKTLELRLIDHGDLVGCGDVFRRTFGAPPWNEKWEAAVALGRLEQVLHTPGSLGVVACSPSIVAFALGYLEPWHNGYHYYLKEACVDIAHQREGIGRRMMAYLAEQLAQRSTGKIYLLTERGDVAESFYTKLGYYTSPKMIMMGKYLHRT